MSPTNPTVGFVGLGNQGAPIAQRIRQAGFPLHVWARRSETVEPFGRAGATIASSPRDLGRSCDVVAICVNSDTDVEEVLLGDGVLSGMSDHGIVMVHSTIAPGTITTLAAAAAECGVALLDAPVSGGPAAALAGRMSVLAGGDATLLEAVRPILATFASTVVHTGPAGTGQLTKLVNNNLCFAHIVLGARALQIAADLGLDREAALDAIEASSGSSFGLRVLREPETLRRMAMIDAEQDDIIGHFSDALEQRSIDDRGLIALSSQCRAVVREELGRRDEPTSGSADAE